MLRQTNTKVKKATNDRFIPRRCNPDNFHLDQRPSKPIDTDLEKRRSREPFMFVNRAKTLYKARVYQEALRDLLLPSQKQVLNFFEPRKEHQKNNLKSRAEEETVQHWPVKGRKKPVISDPLVILDIPNFDMHLNHNVADWSCTNILCTIFEYEVHMLMPHNPKFHKKTNTLKRVQDVVQWNKSGTQLALSMIFSRIAIWDMQTEKIIHETTCCKGGSVTSIKWVNDKCLLIGCTKGTISVMREDLSLQTSITSAHNSIISMEVSYDGQYLSTSGVDKSVKLWSLTPIYGIFELEHSTIVRSMAWHPWRKGLLAIGSGGRITIWKIQDGGARYQEQVTCHCCHTYDYSFCTIDCLTFNPITAELVVSFYVEASNDDLRQGESFIAVLTKLNTTVEELHKHEGRILYLLWGDNGRTLGSASADENLCLWNFFKRSSDGNKEVRKKKTLSLNPIDNMNIFNSYIR